MNGNNIDGIFKTAYCFKKTISNTGQRRINEF